MFFVYTFGTKVIFSQGSREYITKIRFQRFCGDDRALSHGCMQNLALVVGSSLGVNRESQSDSNPPVGVWGHVPDFAGQCNEVNANISHLVTSSIQSPCITWQKDVTLTP